MEVNTVLRRSELRLTTLACRSSNYCTDLVVANIFLRFVFLKYILYIYIFQMLVHVYILITLSLVKFISCVSNTVHYKLCIKYSTLQPAKSLSREFQLPSGKIAFGGHRKRYVWSTGWIKRTIEVMPLQVYYHRYFNFFKFNIHK